MEDIASLILEEVEESFEDPITFEDHVENFLEDCDDEEMKYYTEGANFQIIKTKLKKGKEFRKKLSESKKLKGQKKYQQALKCANEAGKIAKEYEEAIKEIPTGKMELFFGFLVDDSVASLQHMAVDLGINLGRKALKKVKPESGAGRNVKYAARKVTDYAVIANVSVSLSRTIHRLFDFFNGVKNVHNDKKNYGENTQAENNMVRNKAIATARSMQATAKSMENIIKGLIDSEKKTK